MKQAKPKRTGAILTSVLLSLIPAAPALSVPLFFVRAATVQGPPPAPAIQMQQAQPVNVAPARPAGQ